MVFPFWFYCLSENVISITLLEESKKHFQEENNNFLLENATKYSFVFLKRSPGFPPGLKKGTPGELLIFFQRPPGFENMDLVTLIVK